MPKPQTVQNFYRPDELPVLVYRLMGNRDVFSYLKENPWPSYIKLARKLGITSRIASFKLGNLEFCGLLKSELREARKPTATKGGLATRHYALADDFDVRIEEINAAINLSDSKYSERHGMCMPKLSLSEERKLRKLAKEYLDSIKLP